MILAVQVIPNSKKFGISAKDGKVRISLKSPPENNRANIELVKELSRMLGKEVRILSGHTSRKKRLLIDMTDAEWAAFASGAPLAPI